MNTPAAVAAEDAPVLELRGLSAGYDDLAVVRDVDLTVMRGEIVALLGANGTGKSTTILTAAGELPPIGGQVLWRGTATTAPLHVRARMGMSFVPEERSVLMSMSVRDNLLLGPGRIERATELFPELQPLLATRAGLLSGGEQQMLSLARPSPRTRSRCINTNCPTPTHGDGVAVLLVEQQARRAMAVADRWYLLRRGAVAATGNAADGIAAVESLYLGDATATGTE